jgi:hypothetical protein
LREFHSAATGMKACCRYQTGAARIATQNQTLLIELSRR